MTLSDLGTLSQIIGALAVVFSLPYLARQIRQNTRAIRMANATTLQTEFRGLARTLYSDREVAALVVHGMSGKPAASPGDQLSVNAWFFDILKMAELGHYHYRHGDLDPALWEASLTFYRSWFDSPGMRAYWAQRRAVFMPEFRVAMDEWLGSEPAIVRPDQLADQMAAGDVE